MAKKKAIENMDEKIGQDTSSELNSPTHNCDLPEQLPVIEKTEDMTTEVQINKEDIPDYAVNYLKRHTEMKEAYIDNLGGVYPVGTPEVFLKNASLYQNPFYKQ